MFEDTIFFGFGAGHLVSEHGQAARLDGLRSVRNPLGGVIRRRPPAPAAPCGFHLPKAR